jgi:hypothetical protein
MARNAAPARANSLHFGTKVNALFTIVAPKRYASDMLVLLALAAMVPTVPGSSPTAARATVQARAIVRIVSAVTLRLGEGPLSGDAPPAKPAVVHADGQPQPARLIEFQ